ncbi:MAG: transketolase [Thermoanaerobaculia bacterium]
MTDPEDRSPPSDRDRLAIDTLRFLAVDMVERARSGHPGAPMGQAPMAYWLWTRYLRHDPARHDWPNRDRFVLSCGHASALLYGLLHLAGYGLHLSELQRFRRLGSKTPGHPENFLTPGVETTTGPLGQGFGNAVGMAVAEALAAARFNREGFPLFDHRVWVLASDGDLMEGVSSEASSYAGHLRLGKLNVLYDDNRITIDGSTDLTFSEDVGRRYEAYGWHVQHVDDGNDLEALDRAMAAMVAETDRPSLAVVRTHIGYGAPTKQDTAAAHGAALGPEEVRATKEALGWPLEPELHVPPEARDAFEPVRAEGARRSREWDELLERYGVEHPGEAAELRRRLAGELPGGWQECLPDFATAESIATRKASGKALNALAPAVPELVGGSADLSGSNNTVLSGETVFSAGDRSGRNFHFGVREHAMGSMLNGMALSRMFRPYGGTFLVFSDYMRPAVRLAALMRLPVTYVFTHDSIFLGEDGPTHQPEAHLMALRAIPNLSVIRPADARETAAAWRMALDRPDGPTALALTRQGLPVLAGTEGRAVDGVARGAYVLRDPEDAEPEAILIATGSEVWVAVEAAELLATRGIRVRVVSMPSWDLFDAQPDGYRDAVLPPTVGRRLAVEAGVPRGWERYVGPEGEAHGLDGFGASAPWKDLADHFGFTAEAVATHLERMLGR